MFNHRHQLFLVSEGTVLLKTVSIMMGTISLVFESHRLPSLTRKPLLETNAAKPQQARGKDSRRDRDSKHKHTPGSVTAGFPVPAFLGKSNPSPDA